MNLNSLQARIDLQQELETLTTELGITRYREALAKEGDGSMPAGAQLVRAALQPMEHALTEWLEKTAKGLASRSAAMFHFVNQLDPLASAWVTAHACINMLHERPPLTRVALAVSSNMEAALNMDAICQANPALGKRMAKRIEGMNSDKNRAVFIRKGAVMVDVKVIQWDDATRIRVGTLLVSMFAESTGLVALETMPLMRGKTQVVVRPTEVCRRWLEDAHAHCELLSPYRLPMVCPPRDWTNPFNGGYFSKAQRQPLVKTRNRGYLTTLKDLDMPWVYASVNALQATEWAVNREVEAVVRDLWTASSTLGGLPSREEVAVPAKPWGEEDTPDPAVLHAWKVDAARVHELNAKTESKRLQVVQKLWVAEMMVERGNRFHYVYNLDWRGRMYPVGPALTPQGDDVAKGMLQFAQASPLGDDGAYWLAIHCANTFGVDKVSFADRIQWLTDNEEMVLSCAKDPLVDTRWADADSPFCFLAACLEWRKLYVHVELGAQPATFQSHLAVAFDGSCNGLQNFSAMLRDPVGGKATGLIPSETPADIYTEVAKAAQVIIDAAAAEGNETAQRWVGKMTRKLAKRNTMTVPYGVTRRGMRDQLFGELKDSDPAQRGQDADFLAACNFDAIGNVVVAARRAMDWLREAAKVAASTELPVNWVTPAGMLVTQDYRDDVGQELDFTVLGRRYCLLINKTGDKLSTRRQALGISPNFVHSLDAAHLMRTVLFCAHDGVADFAMIHDSYGVHAGKASLLRDNLRAAFIEQYSAPVLEQFRDQLAAQLPEALREELPPLPPMGDLDLELVRHSEYFFA